MVVNMNLIVNLQKELPFKFVGFIGLLNFKWQYCYSCVLERSSKKLKTNDVVIIGELKTSADGILLQ